MLERVKNYFGETKTELHHVNWPSRQNTVRFTLIVIGVSILLAAFLGLLDILFQYILNNFVL